MKNSILVDNEVSVADHKTVTYKMYTLIHEQYSKKNITLKRANNVIGGMLGAAPDRWRVQGITNEALELFFEVEFKKIPKGIQRAHIVNRIDTISEVLETAEPLEMDALFSYWEEHDRTILCLSKQNKLIRTLKFHEIENPFGLYFTNSYIGYSFRQKIEGELLRRMWDEIRG